MFCFELSRIVVHETGQQMFLVYHNKAFAEGRSFNFTFNGAGSVVVAAEHHPFLDLV
jgi:hypothetical protein